MVSEEDERNATPVASLVERGLLNAALDFYGAAHAVIDYAGAERPRLRYDVSGLQAVRAAMGPLEERIKLARRTGMAAERIARITRLEQGVVDMILERQRDAGWSAGED